MNQYVTGSIIRKLREEKKMTQLELAKHLQVSDKTVSKWETGKKNPKFEIYEDSESKFRFRLKATNGEKILASEGYSSKDACKNGISSVKVNAASASVENNY